MAIAYGPFVINSGALFWLPLPIHSWETQLQNRSESAVIPTVAGETLLWTERGGFTLSIRGEILGYSTTGDPPAYVLSSSRTAENAQGIKRVMEGKVVDGSVTLSPFDGTFTIGRWKDRAYTGCRLNSMSFTEGRISSSRIPYSLEIICGGAYVDASDAISEASDDEANTWQAFIGHAGGIK